MPAQLRLDVPRLVLVAILAAALCLLVVRHVPVARVAESWLQDLRVATLTPAAPQSTDIVVVVDELDGTARALVLRRKSDEGWVPGFVTALAQSIGADVAPGTTLRLDYRGAPDRVTPPFPTYPAHAVPLLPHEWFEGRIALVGAVLPFTDRHRTPLALGAPSGNAGTPGVVVLAHGLAQLLDARAARVLDGWEAAVLALAFAGVVGGVARLSLAARVGLTVLVIATSWAAAFWLYHAGRLMLPLLAPTLALPTAAATVVAIERRREHARGRFIRDAFSRFVAPAVVNKLLADPAGLTLTGERRDTSFMFTDLANFTALTERTEPAEVVRLLNEYLDGTCRIVLRHEGTIDKIVGDALHVMFNAPAAQPDHPARAVACALDLDRFCQAFVDRQHAAGIEFGITRIGVNTGVTVVGNVGGATRFDYSARGDAINTAARLESLNKHLGTRVCVSGATAERCPTVDFRPVASLVLKGKQHPIDVFEPERCMDPACAPVDEYRRAYRLLDADAGEARRLFEQLSTRYPADSLVALHSGRLARGESGTVIVMREK